MTTQPDNTQFNSNTINVINTLDTMGDMEFTHSVRFMKYNNPLVNYTYKCGNYIYLRQWDDLYPSLITSLVEVQKGVLSPS